MENWYKKFVLPRLLNSGMGSKELEKIRREVLLDASGVVLEIGSGPGYNFPIYKNIPKLFALEPSRELVEIAKTRVVSSSFPIEFLNITAESIPMPNNSIDTVVSTWTLCSVNNPKQVLKEVARVLRPQGRFLFVDHGASPKIALRLVQKALTSVTKYFTGNCHYDREIEKLISEAGFKIEKIQHPSERFKPFIFNYKGTARRT